MSKKITILKIGGVEMANQLWNFASIYAYCQEKGYYCQNYSFFEYWSYFQNISIDNNLVKFLFFYPFKNPSKKRRGTKNKFYILIYKIYSKIISITQKRRVISSINSDGLKTYIPPTKDHAFLNMLENNNNHIYFNGWLFRNSIGLKKHRNKIIKYFKPKDIFTEPIDKKILKLRSCYKNVIGLHIRQSDYKTHKLGEYFITQKMFRKIIDDYLSFFSIQKEETIFVITSDDLINQDIFSGLNIEINKGNPVEDLYILSRCDKVLGSNSSFGYFASYYGNIPFIVAKKDKINWGYYQNKEEFFENKYSALY